MVLTKRLQRFMDFFFMGPVTPYSLTGPIVIELTVPIVPEYECILRSLLR